MPRVISIVRRRPNLVDLTVQRQPDTIGWRFSAAVNFDTAFTAFQVVPIYGMTVFDTTPATKKEVVQYVGSQYRGLTRFLFDPDQYTATVAAVRDDAPFYIKVERQKGDTTFDTASAMHMILPYSSQPHRSIILSGLAPVGANLGASLEIQLPMQCNDWEIQNEGANSLFVAFERPTSIATGPEYEIKPPAAGVVPLLSQDFTSVSQIFMRGNTDISAVFTARNNPFGY